MPSWAIVIKFNIDIPANSDNDDIDLINRR